MSGRGYIHTNVLSPPGDGHDELRLVGEYLSAKARRHTARGRIFDIDNGAGSTVDDVVIRPSSAITIIAMRIVVTTENFGSAVDGATVQAGTSVGGTQIVAATNLQNGLTVGQAQSLTLASTSLAANTPLIVRHTGIASGAGTGGEYYVEVEYQVDDAYVGER